MSDGYSYYVELVDKISGPAKTAKQQIDALTQGMQGEANEAKKLRDTLEALRGTGALTAAAEKQLTNEIAKKEKAMTAAAGAIRGLVKGEQDLAAASVAAANKEEAAAMKVLDATKKQAAAQAAASAATQNKMTQAYNKAAASYQQKSQAQAKEHADMMTASDDASGLMGTLAEMGPYIAAVAAAFLALGGAVIGFLAWGSKMALDAAQFKKQTMAALQSVTGTAIQANDAFVDIRRISDEIGISEQKAQSLGLSLLDAGVSQKNLGDAIKSIALLEKVRGAEAANKLQELIKKSAAGGAFKMEGESLVGTGISQADVFAELAKKMKISVTQVQAQLKAGKITAADGVAAINSALTTKLGGASITNTTDALAKVWEMVQRLFEDVDVAPLVDAIKSIGQLFDQSRPGGESLKYLATTIFTGLFATAKEVFPYIKVAFLELVIVGLKAYIAFKPVVSAVKDLAAQWTAATGGADVFGAIVSFIGQTIVMWFEAGVNTFLVFVGLISLGIALFEMLGAIASGVWTAIVGGFEIVTDALAEVFSVTGASDMASALIDGLVNGITGGAGRVVKAITDVGQGAIDGVKGVLGIASPSKVMAELGGYTAEGFAQGVDDGSGAAQASLTAAVAPPAGGKGGGGAGGPITIQITIQAGGASAAEIAQEIVPDALATAVEGLLMQLGGGLEPA